MNPYDRIYDPFGELNYTLSWDLNNPLYEANVGSYDKNSSHTFSNDFDIRWQINKEFRVTSHWNLSLVRGERETVTSPASGVYRFETDPTRKGSLAFVNNKELNYSGNLVVSYNKIFQNNSLLTINLGGNVTRADLRNTGFAGVGFLSDELKYINFANSYPLS